ncbi:MAG TPA: hypothetical protein VKU85_00180, partial [bacterium]|nr:hypothetical protein [bacterium]
MPRPPRFVALAAVLLLTAFAGRAPAAPGAQWADPGPGCKRVAGEALLDPADPLANWRARNEPRNGAFAAAIDGCPHDFDVIHYEINFNSVNPNVPNLDGNTVIDLESTVDGLTSIGLNLTSQLTVSSVTVTPNGSAGFSHVGDVLTVNLVSAANTGDPLTVDVAYSGAPANEGAGGFGGFWWSSFPKVGFSMG